MFGKVAGLFKVVDFRGEELNQGTMLRYLNEMTWFPIALLSDYITWQAVDDRAVDVTFTDCGKSVSARLFFGDDGRLLRIAVDGSTTELANQKGKWLDHLAAHRATGAGL